MRRDDDDDGIRACFYCEGNLVGLLIACDRCETWFHFKCVNKKWDLNVRRSEIQCVSEYYCYPCRRANPSLKLKFYSSANYRPERKKHSKRRHKGKNEHHVTDCSSPKSPLRTRTQPSETLTTQPTITTSPHSPPPTEFGSPSSTSSYSSSSSSSPGSSRSSQPSLSPITAPSTELVVSDRWCWPCVADDR